MNYTELHNIFLQIRDEQVAGGNTRQRVYDALNGMLDYMKGVEQSATNADLTALVNNIKNELRTHYTAGTSHKALFDDMNNRFEAAISAVNTSAGKVDVTNLLSLYSSNCELLVQTSGAHIVGKNDYLQVTGEEGSNFMIMGIPPLLSGKYTMSYRQSDTSMYDSLRLVKVGGDEVPFTTERGTNGEVVLSVILAEATAVRGIKYIINSRRANLVLSHLALVSGGYAGYSIPLADYNACLNTKIDVSLSGATPTTLGTFTNEQWLYFYDGVARRITVRDFMVAISKNSYRKRQVATLKDLSNRIYTVAGTIYGGSAVVFLNGQALFEEAGDFVLVDESTIRITKENINDPLGSDKVVVEALFINN